MGNIIFFKERRVYVKPLKSRLEAIQKLQLKVVDILQAWLISKACFSQIYKIILKPIYDLTRKGRQLIWGKV